jgi:uroporphyrinogen decarboxylase
LGFKTQTLIGVNDLRKYVLPWHKRLAEIAHAAGKPCILHCCGNLSEIMEDIIEYVGIDAKHSYEDSILPVSEAKRLYGDRIAILGGFDVDRLCRSSEGEVRQETRHLVENLGADGGYALGSGNSIAAYVPVENYLAMLDEGWRTRC